MAEYLHVNPTNNLKSVAFISFVGSPIAEKYKKILNSFLINGAVCSLYGLTDVGGVVACPIYGHRGNSVGFLSAGTFAKV